MTPFPVQSHLETGALGYYKEQISYEENPKMKFFSVNNVRGKILLDEYLDFALDVMEPNYFVLPCEHILSHTGKKKKIKSCL